MHFFGTFHCDRRFGHEESVGEIRAEAADGGAKAEGLLAPHPTPKLEDHPSSAVCGCLFKLFTATLHIGGRSSIRNPRTCHAILIELPSYIGIIYIFDKIYDVLERLTGLIPVDIISSTTNY